jgi:pfkB family carbohydrate kinase
MKPPHRISLAGTITADRIVYEDGPTFEGLGGILYQTAVLAGLGNEVRPVTNCGAGLRPEVERLTADWPELRRDGIASVAGPGNVVNLFYPKDGERREVLESVVPPLMPERVAAAAAGSELLLTAINSGLDIDRRDWRRVLEGLSCPVWLDIHSLALNPVLGASRAYVAVPDWASWARGVTFLQANLQEVACLLGHPEHLPARGEAEALAREAFSLGVKAVLVTLGRDGVLVLTPDETRQVRAPASRRVVDATGCGDVLCAGAVHRLVRGADIFAAAAFGVGLAARAAGLAGVRQTYEMARAARSELPAEEGP